MAKFGYQRQRLKDVRAESKEQSATRPQLGRIGRRHHRRPSPARSPAPTSRTAGGGSRPRRPSAVADRRTTLRPAVRPGHEDPDVRLHSSAVTDHMRDRHRCRHDRRPQPCGLHRRATRLGSYREFTQYFPQPGWVEHDADEIWDCGPRHAERRGRRRSASSTSLRSASPTSARRSSPGTGPTGVPYGNAIVWQDRRTAQRCDELVAAGHCPSCGNAPAWCSTRTSRERRSNGCWPTGTSRSTTIWRSAPSTPG